MRFPPIEVRRAKQKKFRADIEELKAAILKKDPSKSTAFQEDAMEQFGAGSKRVEALQKSLREVSEKPKKVSFSRHTKPKRGSRFTSRDIITWSN